MVIDSLIIFILACFVGYYVILKVTSALHAPLMAVTNAISSIIIVVAIEIFLKSDNGWLGLIAIFLAALNIFGGLVITNRMIAMFSKK